MQLKFYLFLSSSSTQTSATACLSSLITNSNIFSNQTSALSIYSFSLFMTDLVVDSFGTILLETSSLNKITTISKEEGDTSFKSL